MTSKENGQKTWFRTILYTILVGFIGIIAVGSLQSCASEAESSDSDEQENTIPGTTFEHEGNLTFSYGDSASTTIEIEIAETEGAITQGMMHRKSMKFNRGMLFIFSNNEPRSFWMKNTIVPLDIIFVNPDMKIVSIKSHTTPFSTDSVPSDGKSAQYVIEVNAGFAGKYGIKEGDKVSFDRL